MSFMFSVRKLLQPKPTYSLMDDQWIHEQCSRPEDQAMIWPYNPALITRSYAPINLPDNPRAPNKPPVEAKQISHGLSSFGYDIRLAEEYNIFSAEAAAQHGITLIDPKNFDRRVCKTQKAIDGAIILPAHSFILGYVMEYVRMPVNALAFLLNKSTYARCGIHVWTTVIEPGWHGDIVIEIANHTPLPVKLYAGEGIGQLVFYTGRRPITTYADRQGKYQGQRKLTMARV